ncbi:MAG: 2OG-Fe dioxygenase family protein [Burkholderiales bacterium]
MQTNLTLDKNPNVLADVQELVKTLDTEGFALLDPTSTLLLAGVSTSDIKTLESSWNYLEKDHYLKDGGNYRSRRHASVVISGNEVSRVAHRAHWQPTTYNALHGGIHRWFEPIGEEFLNSEPVKKLLTWIANTASKIDKNERWFSEVHQFRIDTTGGIGRPTPEGAHRDGVDWVALFLIGRHNICGGETHVFKLNSNEGYRFLMDQPWSLILMNDRKVIHETTPIQPIDTPGWRDTLVITLRANGFLDSPE